MTKHEAKKRITDLLQKHLGGLPAQVSPLVPSALTSGKLYEAYILALVARDLVGIERLNLRLVNGNHIALKSSHGPINSHFPHIQVFRSGEHVADIWTDVEFSTLSCHFRGNPLPLQRGDFHELDMIMVDANTTGRPHPSSVWLGVECKNTGYGKGLLKEILGIRRELSLYQTPRPTRFRRWPSSRVSADPASCLLVYSTDPDVALYSAPGDVFGIQFSYEPLNP